jgi:hypothetical protein
VILLAAGAPLYTSGKGDVRLRTWQRAGGGQ